MSHTVVIKMSCEEQPQLQKRGRALFLRHLKAKTILTIKASKKARNPLQFGARLHVAKLLPCSLHQSDRERVADGISNNERGNEH